MRDRGVWTKEEILDCFQSFCQFDHKETGKYLAKGCNRGTYIRYFLAVFAIVPLAPLVVVSVVLKFSGEGEAFRQTSGRMGNNFELLKFATMQKIVLVSVRAA